MATRVQAKGNGTASNVTNLTVTPDAGFTTGNLVRVAVVYVHGTALTISAVRDQASNALTYTEVGSLHNAGNAVGLRYLVIHNVPASVTAINVTLSGTADFGLALNAAEYSGLDTVDAIDTSANQEQTGVGTSANEVTSGSLTPTAQPGVLDAFTVNVNNATTPTAGTGFTSTADDIATVPAGCSGRGEYKAISSTAATAGTFTNASVGGQTFLTFAVMLLDAAGGGGGTGRGRLIGGKLVGGNLVVRRL